MAQLKPSHLTRINKIERSVDVTQMTPAELEYYAALCPDEIRERLKTLSDAQLKKIIAGGYDEL
jgi:hypothetical protein